MNLRELALERALRRVVDECPDPLPGLLGYGPFGVALANARALLEERITPDAFLAATESLFTPPRAS